MQGGKHVLIEIPMADNLADAEALVLLQQTTGVDTRECVQMFMSASAFANQTDLQSRYSNPAAASFSRML